MSDVDIETELQASRARHVIRDGGAEAGPTFSIASPQSSLAVHTGVPDAWRGRGAGRALIGLLVADARAIGFRVVPLRPFVNRRRARHPAWADVFQV